jgi:glutathione synthase/RimK-type ligase-like ATP-grasp enzyme
MDQDEAVVAAALHDIGVRVDEVEWRDATADWGAYDAVVIRSTWDYTDDVAAFHAWAQRVEASGAQLHNPAEVVRWNAHKGYLLELEERGAPIVPTAWLGAGDRVALVDLAAARGWDGLVAKPAVGAGADGLLVVPPGTDASTQQVAFDELVAAGDAMVQPFVRSVRTAGELSVVVVDGRTSHAVRKVPADGEVRTQIEFGATYVAEAPAPDASALAEWLVEATGHDLLYARVDLLADDDGTWLLNELEAVEPALLFAWADGSADRFAQALLARIGRRPTT